MIESNRERAIRLLTICASSQPFMTIRDATEALGINGTDAAAIARRELVKVIGIGGLNAREARAEAAQRLREHI